MAAPEKKLDLFKQTVMGSLKVSMFVGAILNLINQGGALLSIGDGANQPIHWGNVVLNFIVPFCVAAYSRFKALNEQKVL